MFVQRPPVVAKNKEHIAMVNLPPNKSLQVTFDPPRTFDAAIARAA